MELEELLKIPPSRILHVVTRRTELRPYIDAHLPGWGCWFRMALQTLHVREQDELDLQTKKNIVATLEQLGCEMREELGALGRRVGEAYAQKAPFQDLSEQVPLENYTRWQGEGPQLGVYVAAVQTKPIPFTDDGKGGRPFSHAELGGRVASRDVIGNLLALGHLKSLKRQRQKGLELRRQWAAHMVALEFGRFLQSNCPGEAVLPERFTDPTFDESTASREGVSKALAIVVAAYLGHPGMYSPYVEGLGEDELNFPDSIFDSTETKLNEALKAPDENVWHIRQGTLVPDDD